MATAQDTDLGDLTIGEAARLVKPSRPGSRVHSITIIRWIVDGTRARDGGRIKLVARRQPGCWIVPHAELIRFLDRVTADRTGQSAPPAPSAEVERRAAARDERVERDLIASGF